MKNNELVKNQKNQASSKVLPQTSQQAQKLLNNKKPTEPTTETKETKATEKVKKEPKVRGESNEAAGERLLKEKASEATIIAHYTAYYKAHGVTDKVFIAKRAAIYMKIAKKREELKKSANVKK
jgi:hypothetical protein